MVKHDIVGDTTLDKDDSDKEDTLLTYMAARGKSDTHPGDTRRVLANRVMHLLTKRSI
jgi:hypothetical protein